MLRELTSQPPGQYLLSHDSRTGAFVRLSRASASGGGSVQLSLPLEPRWVALESPRSLAIDPSILIPFNTRNGRVPATFRYKKAPGSCLLHGTWDVAFSRSAETPNPFDLPVCMGRTQRIVSGFSMPVIGSMPDPYILTS